MSQFSPSALRRLGGRSSPHPFTVAAKMATNSGKRQRRVGTLRKYGPSLGCMATLTAPVVNRLSSRTVESFARADTF